MSKKIKVILPVERWCEIIDTLQKSDAYKIQDFESLVDGLTDQVREGHVENGG